MTAKHLLHHLGVALERHCIVFHTGNLFQFDRCEVWDRANAQDRIVETTGPGFGCGEQVRHGLDRQIRMRGKHHLIRDRLTDVVEGVQRIAVSFWVIGLTTIETAAVNTSV